MATFKAPADQGSSLHCIVTRPQRDLLVFQVPNIVSLELQILRVLTFNTHIGTQEVACVRNLGIEFDPQWAGDLGDAIDDKLPASYLYKSDNPVSCLLWGFSILAEARKVWLVDHHTLRLMPGVDLAKIVEDRKVFKARGRTYVEVLGCDQGDRWRFAKGIKPQHSVWLFANEMCVEQEKCMTRRALEDDMMLQFRIAAYIEDG